MKTSPSISSSNASNAGQAPTFQEAFRFWLKLGFISFGGPTGQIAIMHTELVEKRRWVSEEQFLHALNFCMVLPGPEAQQLATYMGWMLHRTWGGIVAGALFVIPSMVLLWALSVVYALYGRLDWMVSVFDGLKPAVLAIVLSAGLRIGKKALKTRFLSTVAALAFVAIFVFKVPFPALVIAAGIIGWMADRWGNPQWMGPRAGDAQADGAAEKATTMLKLHTQPSWRRAFKVLMISLGLWWSPVAILAIWLGSDHVLVKQGLFFSKAAMVTFGGAYAVLPYVSQQAVEQFHWLEAGQMLDGLGLAETTPGPLIMVLQFVGFLGAWKFHEPLSPMLAATLGALITTWTTFLPCFLWIFLGAPHIEALRGNRLLTAALTCITAAVVGVIFSLAVWFGIHVLVPDFGSLRWFGLAVAVVTFVGMTRWKWGVMPVVLGAGLCGALKILFSTDALRSMLGA